MSTGNREDYLINILRLTEGERAAKTTELATFMKISPASVTEMLKVLAADGYVNYERYKGVTLTESGMNYARQIRKKHHVVENFLINYMDMDPNTAHNEACKMEHVISTDYMLKMCHIVGTPVDSDCQSCESPCKPATGTGPRNIESMDCMKVGDTGKISHIKSDDTDIVRRLMSMGFVPGRPVTLKSKLSDKGPRIIGVGDSTIALDAEMAAAIFVDTVV